MINYLDNFLPIVRYEINAIDNQPVVVVNSNNLLCTMNNLKLHINFLYNLLSNVSAVDLVELKYRFVVVYELLSVKQNQRLTLKVFLDELTIINSLVSIFKNANWWEREVWDMFGIFFENHPDLRRILTDYGFQGFPLRKDFPLSGYIEVQYDESTKKVEICPISLVQEMRKYDYDLRWSQADNGTVTFKTNADKFKGI